MLNKKLSLLILLFSVLTMYTITSQVVEAAPEIPVPKKSKNAGSWLEFQKWIKDSTVDEIKITANFRANDDIISDNFPSRNLIIDGQDKFTFDAGGSTLNMAVSNSTTELLTVKNLRISGIFNSQFPVFNTNGNTLHLKDVILNNRGLIDSPQATVYISGVTTFETDSVISYLKTMINSKELIIEDDFSFVREKTFTTLFNSTALNSYVTISNSIFKVNTMGNVFESTKPTAIKLINSSIVNVEKADNFIKGTQSMDIDISDSILNVGEMKIFAQGNRDIDINVSHSTLNLGKLSIFAQGNQKMNFTIGDSKLNLEESKEFVTAKTELTVNMENSLELVGKDKNELGLFSSSTAPVTVTMNDAIIKGTKDIGYIAKTESVEGGNAPLTVNVRNSTIELEQGGFFSSSGDKLTATIDHSRFNAKLLTNNFLKGKTLDASITDSTIMISSIETQLIYVALGDGGSKLNFVNSEIYLRQEYPLTNSLFIIEDKGTETDFNNTNLDSRSNGRLFTITNSAIESKLIISNGSKWDVYSKSNNVFRTGSDVDDSGTNEDKAKRGTKNFLLRIDGEDTKVNFSGDSNLEGVRGGILSIIGPSSRLEMDNGAYLSVKSLNAEVNKGISTPSIMIQSLNGGFYLDNGSVLDVENHSANPPNNKFNQEAAIRFRTAGSMTFQMDHQSSINVLKKGVSAGVRMFGGDNRVLVKNGSDFTVRNVGDGKASDGGYAGNMAVQFLSNNSSLDSQNQFVILGKDSNINLVADAGLAIDGGDDQLEITASKDAYFVARGQSDSANVGIFNAQKMNINFDTMNYSDFANTRLDGGALFSGKDATSTLNAAKTNLSLWVAEKDQNVMVNDPNKYLASQQFNLSGINLANFRFGSEGIKTYLASIGGTDKISRMTGNNQRAMVDDLRVPTNADKYIWAHAVVKEGKGATARPAYENEVHVKVKVLNVDGTIAYTTQGVSMGNGAEGKGYSVYSEAKKTGLVQIPVPEGNFIEAGQTVQVVEAWIDLGDDEIRLSEAEDVTATAVTTLDVIPPTPVVVLSAPVTNAMKQLVGTANEEGAKVFVKVNNEWLKDSEGQLVSTVVSERTWSINLPRYVTAADKVDIFLKNHVVIERVPKESLPITYTMNPDGIYGNINQAAEGYSNYKGYHDKIDIRILGGEDLRFTSAVRLVTEDVIPVPKLEQSVVSSGGQVTSHEDVLTYSFKVTNHKEKAEPWKNVVLMDVLTTGLLFDPIKHEVTINGVAATEKQFSYEESTRTLKIQVGDIKGNETIDVVFKVKVSREVPLEENILNRGTVIGNSPQEELFIPGANTSESIYKILSTDSNEIGVPGNSIYGLLSFVSAPEKLDFGKIRYSATTKRVEVPKFEKELVIGDSRENVKNGWYMTATLAQPMLNEQGKELVNALRYTYKGKEEILNTNARIVYTKSDVIRGEYPVSKSWGNKKGDDGVKLQIEGKDSIYTGFYQGVITWKLMAGQP